MKDLLKITAATAALAFGISGANAAMLLHTDPVSDEKVVINTETQSEAPVLMATDGQPPADCPEGAFFIVTDPNDQSQIVTECVTGVQHFVGEADDGTFAAQGFPEGAFLLSQDPISGQKEVTTGEEAERRAAPMGVEPQQ
jgi:hypothetical protein